MYTSPSVYGIPEKRLANSPSPATSSSSLARAVRMPRRAFAVAHRDGAQHVAAHHHPRQTATARTAYRPHQLDAARSVTRDDCDQDARNDSIAGLALRPRAFHRVEETLR